MGLVNRIYGAGPSGIVTGMTPGLQAAVATPAGFSWSPPELSIVRTASRYRWSLDIADRIFATGQRLYVRPSGNNANTGLSIAQAKRSWWSALNAVGATPTEILIESGRYGIQHSWSGGSNGIGTTADVIIRATSDLSNPEVPGVAISSMVNYDAVWTNDVSGAPNVWQTTFAGAAPYAVMDHHFTGPTGQVRLSLVSSASVAAVNATPGTWYWAANVIYVHTTDGRMPDLGLKVYPDTKLNGWINDASRKVILEGLWFEGGSRPILVSAVKDATFIDCRFEDGQLEGLGMVGSSSGAAVSIYSIRCYCTNNTADGFQYTNQIADTTTHVIEAECVSVGNGLDGSNQDQASTAHSITASNVLMNVIRVNGRYENSCGANIADVGGTESFSVGCIARGTRATADDHKVNIWVEDTHWITGCTLSNNLVDVFGAVGSTFTVDNSYAHVVVQDVAPPTIYEQLTAADVNTFLQGQTGDAVTNYSPAAFWTWNEASGNALDQVASNALVPAGAATRVASPQGNAGTTTLNVANYWAVASNTAFNVGTSAWAYLARVKFTAVGGGSFWLSKGNSTAYYAAGLDALGYISVLGKPSGAGAVVAQVSQNHADSAWRWVLLGRSVTSQVLWIGSSLGSASTAMLPAVDLSTTANNFGLYLNLFGTALGGATMQVDHLLAFTGAAAEGIYTNRALLYGMT